VESEPGHGAAFRFTIPAQAMAEPASRPPAKVEVQPADLPNVRIIVADDNAVNRMVALRFLSRLGYQADAAVNGLELVASLSRTAYDVIFMDVQMPEMDGIEATRQLRRDLPPDRQPRIIAMTAAAFPEDRARCLEAGMDDYISKPVDLSELADALRRVPCRATALFQS